VSVAEFDYVIVGGGAAGCVLANRLSESGDYQVLLIEAGPADSNPLIKMPKGFGALLQNTTHVRHFTTIPPSDGSMRQEDWPKGMTLGGSSSVNGALYVRGQPEDYNDWEALGAKGWGWDTIGECFKKMEDNAVGPDGVRGIGGPLHVSPHPHKTPLSEAVIDAGVSLGLTRKDDVNALDQEGIGYTMRTIKDGVRVSAASAFLTPIKHRTNLHIATKTFAEKVLFDGQVATGVQCRQGNAAKVYKARKEVVLAAGSIQSPQLLQLSGIGDPDHLEGLGIDLVAANPNVGENLREHWMGIVQYKLKQPVSANFEFGGLKLLKNALQYLFTRKGIMSTSSHEVYAFVKTDPKLERPDAEIVFAPFSLNVGPEAKFEFEKWHGIQIHGFQLRPESQGFVKIRSADPAEQPDIFPNYFDQELDRNTAVNTIRYIRKLCESGPLAEFIDVETTPGSERQSDDEILEAVKTGGSSVFHACGTCRMGEDEAAVLDSRLRVRGVQGLRVVDASVMPTIVSGNTAAASMVVGWRGSDLILEDA
jgi:choline dehydrogenase